MKNFIQKNFTTIVLVITLLSFFTLNAWNTRLSVYKN